MDINELIKEQQGALAARKRADRLRSWGLNYFKKILRDEDYALPERIDAFVVLSCGRFTPDGPDGAKTPAEVEAIEESEECQWRVAYAVARLVAWKINHPPPWHGWPLLVLNGASQQLAMMETWAKQSIAKYQGAEKITICPLGPTAFPYTNTRTQFEDLNQAATEHGWRNIVIVSSDYHVPRCRLYFKYLDPQLWASTTMDYLPWCKAGRTSYDQAKALMLGEMERWVKYTESGDIAFPWMVGAGG